jgi:DNA-binding response OmpR family regulator
MAQRILIVEDESELTKILAAYLERAGYQVISSSRGDEGLVLFQKQHPDLILLDLNLPGLDGLDFTRTVRRTSEVPIIMVTARVEETDRLIGLELGADDYIIKPFSPREVVARVKTVLKRVNTSIRKDSILKRGNLEIHIENHTVHENGIRLELTPTEYSILLEMASHPGRVYSRLLLLDITQGSAYEGYERTIDAHVKNLRSKLEPTGQPPHYILTVFGVGYKFNDEL